MRNDLCHLVIGLAFAPAFVDAPPQSSSTTLLARSKILASRLLTLTLVLAGLAAPLTILGEPRAADEVEINARVFRLYGLTPEEIQLVEETTKK